MLSLVGFIARLSEPPTPYELSPAERSLLYPGEDDLLDAPISRTGRKCCERPSMRPMNWKQLSPENGSGRPALSNSTPSFMGRP